MKKRIQFLYEEGNITYLDILLKSKNIGDLVRETEYARQLYEYDRDMILDYEEVRQDVIARQERLETQKSEMETMKEEYTAQKASLEETINTRKTQLTNFDAKLALAKEKAEEYARAVQEKTEQIRKLRAEEELRRQQEISRQLQERQRAMTERYQDGTPIKSTGGTEFGRSVADYALQFVGNPYVWGGTSLTNGADCSGFTQSVYRHFGVSIPRTSGEQANYGKEIAYEDMEPGDFDMLFRPRVHVYRRRANRPRRFR
ncbi:MAG: NlpC/P60 family protein [Hungatella hathewayi]